jgi:glycosyltransferase involved in cell wall biosynthesis
MKILWLTWEDLDNPLSGGAEVVNEELAARLARDGHDVVFFTAGFKGAARTTTRRGFHIVRVGSRYTSYLAAPIEYFRHWRGWPDLVIDECNTMPFFASYYTTGRQVLFFHMLCRQIWFYQFPQPLSTIGYLAEPIYLRILRRHLPVITGSSSTKQDLVRQGYKPAGINIISQGTHIDPVTSFGTITKFPEPTILSLGTVRPMKRTLHQIQAFELAKKTIPNLRLVISGDTSSRYGRRVLDYIQRSPHRAHIDYLGRVSDAHKTKLMQRAHLITVTSIKEGWGLIVTEAASQGTPAVVYDVDGLRDAVRHDRTGLITEPNPQALANSIIDLLADPARFEAIRHAAWEWSRTMTFDHAYADFKRALNL